MACVIWVLVVDVCDFADLLIAVGEGFWSTAAVVCRGHLSWFPVSSSWGLFHGKWTPVPHWHTFWKWRRQIKWKITNVKACNLCLFRWQVWPAVLLHNTQLLERLREMSSSLTWTGSSNLAWCTGFIYTTLLWITLCKYLMPQSFGLTPH